jgi:hypothetical protein
MRGEMSSSCCTLKVRNNYSVALCLAFNSYLCNSSCVRGVIISTSANTHTGSEACSHFSVYFKHMARRFKELKIDSLLIARMDLTDESPPPHLNLVVGKLPLVIMLPAGSKSPPWTYFSGKYCTALALCGWEQSVPSLRNEFIERRV